MTDGDRAIVVAIELLRDRVTQLPLAIAQNAAQATEDAARRNPAPGGRPPAGGEPGRVERTAAALVGGLVRLLGPLAALNTFLSQSTSGFSVFTGALRLFAAAVAPVVLPVLFSLAVGLAAASEVVFHRLLPALEGFDRFVIGTMVPAMTEFATTVGHAADALRWLADSKVGGALAAGAGGGGAFGDVNRAVERGGVGDWLRAIPGVGVLSSGIAGLAGRLGIGPGAETRGGADPTGGAVGRARSDVLREMILAMGPRGSVGSVSGVYSRAQMAALNQSPFERRMLEMMQAVVTRLARAEAGGGPGAFTAGDPGAFFAWMRSRGFRITGG